MRINKFLLRRTYYSFTFRLYPSQIQISHANNKISNTDDVR